MFDVESRELEKDIHYYQTCLESLLALSENAKVFCLVHKMDLIQEDQRSLMFDERAEQLKKLSLPLQVRNSNREFLSDQNCNREFSIQLIQRRFLIHFVKFYITNVPKNLLCVIIINLK